jgi:hypothetical protein
VEDDHVDRPGVEAQQCAKLTGTNSSIGLIILIACARIVHGSKPASLFHALCRPGGYGGVAAPDPIPNSAVKRPSADGTLS